MSTKPDSQRMPKLAPNPALKFWREVGQNLVNESIKSTEDAGRQVIVAAGILEGLYFHAITYTNLRGGLTGWQLGVYLIPIVCWLASLCAALLIFFPHRYDVNINSSDACKQIYEDITRHKLARFQIAAIFLGLGILGLVPALALYLIN